MSTTVFPYRIQWAGGVSAGLVPRLETVESEAGTLKVRRLSGNRRFEWAGQVVLSGEDGHSFADWLAFQNGTLNDGAATVLVKAPNAALHEVVGESIGTVAGGGGETFALDKKFVHHTDFSENASTLKVYVAGVLQVLTTDYTVSGNGTAPLITSTASMDTGAATANYEFYFQCHVFQAGAPQSRSVDKTADTSNPTPQAIYVPVTIREASAGGYLV